MDDLDDLEGEDEYEDDFEDLEDQEYEDEVEEEVKIFKLLSSNPDKIVRIIKKLMKYILTCSLKVADIGKKTGKCLGIHKSLIKLWPQTKVSQ